MRNMASAKRLLKPQTLYDCVHMLGLVQFWVFCNGIWLHRRRCYIVNKWTRLYTVFGALTILLGLSYAVYAIVNNPRERATFGGMNRLVLSIAVIELVMSSAFMFSITVFSMQRHAHRHAKLYMRLHNLDCQLIREFGVNLNYYKLMRKNKIIISIVVAGYLITICSALFAFAKNDVFLWILMGMCYIAITGGPNLCGYVLMNLAEIIMIRFRLLQKLISMDYLMKRFPNEKLREQRLLTAIQSVKELFLLIDEINKVYMWCLISLMAHDFTLTTSELYYIFGQTMSGHVSRKTVCYVACFMFLPLYKMILTPMYCERTIKEGKVCIRIIERVDNWFPGNEKIKRLVESIMHWRMDKKIEFTLGIHIKYNKTIISTVTILIFNYLLILIQFHMTEEMGDEIAKQKNTIKNWIKIDQFNITLF